mgnify:CR=1 FL=1|tara:strand:- start:185 stop:1426 length:1242 start_codon:yes stop_codon:yes gene_type:complete
MGSVVISGATSGAVTLAVPDEAGTRTLTLPATTGTILTNDISQAGDTSAGNAAAVGYTSVEGLILTGQGSTSDVTIKNDADATVISIPTGSTGVTITSSINVLGSNFANVEFTGASVNGSGVYTGLDSGGGYVVNVRDSGYIGFSTTNAERMRIAADGKVGIGTTAPDSLVEIASGGATTAKVSTSATNSYAEIIFEDGNAGYGFQVRSDGAQSISAGSMVINDRDTGSFPFVIKEGNATNTVVLSGSNTCFNSTAIGFANQRAVQIQTSSTGLIAIQHLNTEVSGAAYIWFTHNGNPIGSIVQDGTSGLTYNTASDYRLKENVNYSWDATTRLKQLKPARFNFITDQEKGTVDGFLAHEVSSVVPSAITGEKDAVDSDGKPIHQGIDQSKLVPLLVKTIQELEARITALEAG